MRTLTKRILSITLALCMCLPMLLTVKLTAKAAAYENTHINTGNQAYDIVAIAQTQVGYQEGTNNDNKYGAAFGHNNVAWCAYFVSWCAKEAEISDSIIHRQGIASPFRGYFNVPNTHGTRDYFPKPGDLVFYGPDSEGDHYHVGIVETVNKSTGYITTIEGNTNSNGSSQGYIVYRHTRHYQHSTICCYGTPNYNTQVGEHTCNKGTYVFYEAAHPHYKCYECSICGAVWRNTAEPTIVSSCTSCVPEKVSDSEYSSFLPIAAYPISTGHISVYDNTGTEYSNRYIEGATDLCLILEIYTDGWCKVKYPSSAESSGYFTAYVPFSTFAMSASTSSWICTGNYTTYRRSDLSETMHTVNNGDSCLVVGTSGGLKQIIHPTPINGQTCFMMGWVKEPKTHTHNYTGNRVYETAHPHRISQRCVDYATCGGYIWTDEYYELKTCEQCWHATFNIGASSISVNVGESKTVSASVSGCWPDSAAAYRELSPDNDVVEVTFKNQQVTFTGLKAGTTNFSMTVYSDSSKSHVIGTITIPVTVTEKVCTHSYSYKVTKEPTVSTAGTLTGTCSNCSGTTTVTLPKLSTTDYTYSVVKEPSYAETGTGRYTWKTTTYGTFHFDVTLDKLTAELTKIEIASNPTKTVYQIGETLDTTGLSLKATYSDGSAKTITGGFTTSGFDSSSTGEKTVTVSFNGKTAAFTVTVVKAEEADPNAPQFTVGSKSAISGQTITVEITAANMPSVKSLMLENFRYDSQILEFVSAELNLKGALIADWDSKNMIATVAFAENTDINGVIMTLTFRVKEDAEGECPIACDVYANQIQTGGNETQVKLTVVPGTVTVMTYARGDVNGDGYVNSDDAIYLLRCTLSPSRYPINQSGDMNGDGYVNSDDAIYLLRHTLSPVRYPLN